jgi:hypothetical protein
MRVKVNFCYSQTHHRTRKRAKIENSGTSAQKQGFAYSEKAIFPRQELYSNATRGPRQLASSGLNSILPQLAILLHGNAKESLRNKLPVAVRRIANPSRKTRRIGNPSYGQTIQLIF